MTIRPLAKVLAAWLFWHPAAPPEPEPVPALRIIGPGAPIESTKVHLGLRFHSDAIGDAAITVQVTASALSL